ncbi:hypothetical protein J3B02_006206 [Coemansia erecta]|uniref:Uncharacterized protein n=1 Tax=Coemansia asiatica TaxID=1052880 RepID=A0A9W7XN74_9FUNG|nr:hypothetical protein LPJ64_002209 [Coemansia asiatica]KAJ2840579.1 hypothetical protein J3B02_006206 [Coemansia erecta]KAJ2880108.1 hypothetical protein FB639_002912 [Coemansia asiatica]
MPQNANRAALPQKNFVNKAYANEPVVIQPHGGPHYRQQQPRLQPVNDHYQQQQQHYQNQARHQQQAFVASETFSPFGNDTVRSSFSRNHLNGENATGGDIVNYYGGFDDYEENPISSRSMGRGNRSQNPYGAYDPGYEHSQRPTTASTVGSAYAMGVSHPAESHSKHGHQQLLPKLSIPSDNEKMSYSESSTASAGYSPPSQPFPASTQYSATSQLSRNKTVKDRYTSRKAGGDSCMGECCESCCGRFMRCTCCCIGPIISWALVLLVLVGIALALYFNWDKITNKIHSLDNTPATPSRSTTPASSILSSVLPV